MDDSTGTACLVLSNIPAGSFCGIDLLSFTTSPRFQGIRHLPSGWHVVFTGANNTFSSRHGAWFFVEDGKSTAPQLIIKNWNVEAEELVAETDAVAMLSRRANLGSIWREGLTPYRQTVPSIKAQEEREGVEESADWGQLTSCISEALLARVTGASSNTNHWTLTSASSTKRDADSIPGLSKDESAIYPEKELGFLPIDLKQTWREGAVGRERTIAARDRSWALKSLIETYCKDPMDVIGELQFCFLMVLTLNNYSCLEQWRRLLTLLLTCQAAITDYSQLFVKLLSALSLQLRHCQDAEGGLFDLSEQGGSLLRSLLLKFREGLQQVQGLKEKTHIVDELEDLEDYLKEEHGWTIGEPLAQRGMLRLADGEEVWIEMNRAEDEDESGDYLPVIVDMTPEQAEELGRSREKGTSGSALPSNRPHAKSVVVASDDDESSDEEKIDDEYAHEEVDTDDDDDGDPRF